LNHHFYDAARQFAADTLKIDSSLISADKRANSDIIESLISNFVLLQKAWRLKHNWPSCAPKNAMKSWDTILVTLSVQRNSHDNPKEKVLKGLLQGKGNLMERPYPKGLPLEKRVKGFTLHTTRIHEFPFSRPSAIFNIW